MPLDQPESLKPVLVQLGDNPVIAASHEEIGGVEELTLSPANESLRVSWRGEAQDWGDEQFGTQRIAHIAADSRYSPEQVITSLHTAMLNHLGGREVNDDVTMLCVDRV